MSGTISIMLYEEGASSLIYDQMIGSDYALRRVIADANSAIRAITSIDCKAYVCDVRGKAEKILKTEINRKALRVHLNDLAKICRDGLDGVILVCAHAKNNAL